MMGDGFRLWQQGIVVQHRRNSITLVTPDDSLLLVGKAGGSFRVPIDGKQAMVLRGDAMVGTI